MVLLDTSLYTRHRKRILTGPNLGGVPWTNSIGSTVNSGVTEVLSPVEETWDRKNGWPKWQWYLRNLRHQDTWGSLQTHKQVLEYYNRMRMVDIGGPFYNKKESVRLANRIIHLTGGSVSLPRVYNGPVEPSIITNSAMRAGPFLSAFEASDEHTLDQAGATAISQCAPTNSHAEVLTAIGELYRDGIPKVPGAAAYRGIKPHTIGEEYLNYQFALVPTISDAKDLYKSLRDADRLLRAYFEGSGRLTRRDFAFPTQTNTTTSLGTPRLPAGGTGISDSSYWTNTGRIRTTVKTTVDRWFSGAFTYYAKGDDNLLGNVKTLINKYDYLYGVVPDTEALWNLTPWSWAIDWVTNMGDVMNNLSLFSQDGLVMKYGYVMEHQVREVTYSYEGGLAKNGTVPEAHAVFVQETKRRRAATPFGFGLELDGFTARQWAILAALGLTRSGSLAH